MIRRETIRKDLKLSFFHSINEKKEDVPLPLAEAHILLIIYEWSGSDYSLQSILVMRT